MNNNNGSDFLIYGTCVALGDRAAILQGPSGSGKSDLALRFLAMGEAHGQFGTHGDASPRRTMLVSDDQVIVRSVDGRLLVRPPGAIAGKLEVRGLGIIDIPYRAEAELRLMVALTGPENVPRIPSEATPIVMLFGAPTPLIKLSPFDASAPIKLRLALDRLEESQGGAGR
jgi:HPr kinase/phosphorylase